jgi:hypothetical protein
MVQLVQAYRRPESAEVERALQLLLKKPNHDLALLEALFGLRRVGIEGG